MVGFFAFVIFVMFFVFCFGFVVLLFGSSSESEELSVGVFFVGFHGIDFDGLGDGSFKIFFVFFGFKDGKFFLFDPFGVDVGFFGSDFFFEVVVDVDSFAFVVFFEGDSLGFFGFGFFRLFRGVFFSFFDVFFLVEVVFDVADVSFSSSFFSDFVSE